MNWLDTILTQYSRWLSTQWDELATTIDWFFQWLLLTVGEWVREIRYANDLTQGALAEHLGVDIRTVQHWEVVNALRSEQVWPSDMSICPHM